MRHSYPGKRCENPRDITRNGELHRFCKHHQRRANRNLQILQQRQRIQRKSSSHMRCEENQQCQQQLSGGMTASSHQPYASEFSVNLDDEDLRSMLVDEICDQFQDGDGKIRTSKPAYVESSTEVNVVDMYVE